MQTLLLFLSNFLGPFGLIGTVFWIWMLYDCLKNGGKDRSLWIWVLLLFNVIGAGLYFFIYWLPQNQQRIPIPRFLNRWRLRDALWQAEAEAKNIGKAHQYVKLGDVLYNMGEIDKSLTAYQQAIEKEPNHSKARWGAASIASNRNNFQDAIAHLVVIMQADPNFAYGDASLLYGEVLAKSGDRDAAKAHLENHLKNWSHPESYLLLAELQQQQGEIAEARETLETMIVKIKGSLPFFYRKNQHFVKQGEKILKNLARSAPAERV